MYIAYFCADAVINAAWNTIGIWIAIALFSLAKHTRWTGPPFLALTIAFKLKRLLGYFFSYEASVARLDGIVTAAAARDAKEK